MSAPSRPRWPRPSRISGGTHLRHPLPSWIEPMLATLVEPAPLPAGWIYEPKLDGVRCLAFVDRGRVGLWSRNRKLLNGAYPEIAEALPHAVRGDGVFDGEVVAIDPATGLSSFALLQQRMQLREAGRARRTGVAVEYWIFDCPFYEGLDLRSRPLAERKQLLRDVVRPKGPIKLTPSWEGDFARRLREVCARGGEGLIGKRLASRYVVGRSRDWVKLKCVSAQEFVIGGWTDPKGSREALGALLVGHFDEEGRLRYAGKVGTGYTRETLGQLAAALRRWARRTSPFAGPEAPRDRDAHWVSPTMVAQIGFSEWTPDGMLRHPRFLGLRTDKAAREVRRERPERAP